MYVTLPKWRWEIMDWKLTHVDDNDDKRSKATWWFSPAVSVAVTRWSRSTRYATFSSVSSGMGDCLRAQVNCLACNQPPRPTQPSIPPQSDWGIPGFAFPTIYSWYSPAIAGKAKPGMAHSDCGWTCECAGKTFFKDLLRTRAISERFWGDDVRTGAISSVRTFSFNFHLEETGVTWYSLQNCNGKYDPTLPIATLIAPPGVTHWNCAHFIVRSTIYANTILRLRSLSGTASHSG